jgi:3-deoxy-D-manno-octulosonic-acid transferase
VILVDTMGELPQIYPAATVVFVGGSLVPVGGHNMLEPAGLGLAVVIGPFVFKCAKDVGLLVGAEAGIRARDKEDLRGILLALLDDPVRVRALGERAEQTLVAYQGATDKIMEQLEEVLGVKPEALPVA